MILVKQIQTLLIQFKKKLQSHIVYFQDYSKNQIDYKFKNTYDYPIIINTYTKDSNLYIEFWSNKEVNKNITYEPISFTNGRSAQTYLYGYDVDGNHDENFKKYWRADLHLIGKDIHDIS